MTEQFAVWTENDAEQSARWGSTSNAPAPKRIVVAWNQSREALVATRRAMPKSISQA